MPDSRGYGGVTRNPYRTLELYIIPSKHADPAAASELDDENQALAFQSLFTQYRDIINMYPNGFRPCTPSGLSF
jgi:hypothetical protein